MQRIRILFVCTGNICRSPTAEAVLRHQIEQAGLAHWIAVQSAGTHSYNLGDEPDERAQAAAAQRGYRMKGICARRIGKDDFRYFDYLLAMDENNLAVLKKLSPVDCTHKLALFMGYSARYSDLEVPDPYSGGSLDFERVLDMVEDASRGLLIHLREKLFAESEKT